nr:urokinase-type plasminogen activator-like [Penaeus vannamei]
MSTGIYRGFLLHTFYPLLRVFLLQEEEEDEQQFHVSSMTLHPQFDKGPYLNNDIAILTVKRKSGKGIRFGKYVQPLCLVPPGWNYPSYLNCTVAGWGSLGPELGHSKVLQSAALPILPDSTCRADYVYGPTRLTEGMYCAGYMEGGIDTCQGDSGGPMVCVVDGRHTVVGITSWGHGCARANKPGVYTKLTKYLSWVYSNMR